MELKNYRSFKVKFAELPEIKIGGMAHPMYNNIPFPDILKTVQDHGYRVIVALEKQYVDEVKNEWMNINGCIHYNVFVNDFKPFSTPDYFKIFKILHKSVVSNDSILFHCKAGIGRTGSALAAILLLCNMDRLFAKNPTCFNDYDSNNCSSEVPGSMVGESVKVSSLLDDVISKIRTLKNSADSIETEEQVRSLVELEKTLVEVFSLKLKNKNILDYISDEFA